MIKYSLGFAIKYFKSQFKICFKWLFWRKIWKRKKIVFCQHDKQQTWPEIKSNCHNLSLIVLGGKKTKYFAEGVSLKKRFCVYHYAYVCPRRFSIIKKKNFYKKREKNKTFLPPVPWDFLQTCTIKEGVTHTERRSNQTLLQFLKLSFYNIHWVRLNLIGYLLCWFLWMY